MSSRLPKAKPWSNQRKLGTLAALVVVALAVVGGGLWWAGKLFGRPPFTGLTWTVKREMLKVTIVERGSLESAKNGDIICTVRSGTKGSTIATSIKWIIDPGVEVTKGEKIMELDSSGFVEQLKDQNIKVDQAKANWVTANEQYRIQESQNESDIEAAKNVLDLAKIDLEKYEKGDFIQSLKDVEGRIETARSDLEMWKDRSAWSARMFKKGLYSKVQTDADESRVDGSRIALEKVEEEKRVLVDYMKKRTIQDLTAKLAEAKRALDRVKSQAKAKLAQADADRLAKDSVYTQEQSRKQEIEGEIAKCNVVAPQDGLVVYYVPEQVRGGGGSQQSIVAQGEPVREGQKMLQIPDLSHMMVNVRVHEAMVSTLHNEEDPTDKSTWQPAQIRVDAFPARILRGHIKTVDTVAAQQDWFASDVKVYKTMVSIDESMEGLKPGMSAEVTIYADESTNEVLVVPVQTVIGSITMGGNRKCFVVGADGQPEMRDIVVGMSNQRLVEVKSGLQEGDKVVLNPGPLLAEDGDMKPGKVHTKSDDDAQDSGGDGKKGKKGKKKASGAVPENLKGPLSPGLSPAPGGPGGKTVGGPSDEQKQAFAEKMRNSTPAERREMINRLPQAARDTARQKLREQNLEVAD
jgi:multidrug efflux pump subunit AcrA (membrane-fusion protein)